MTLENSDHDDENPVGSGDDLTTADVPPGVDRRVFMMRTAVVSAAAVMTGCSRSETEQRVAATPAPAAAPPAAPSLSLISRS